MDPEAISSRLDGEATREAARAAARQVAPLKGVRGVPPQIVARTCAEAWRAGPPRLPDDEDALALLFTTAWEDGLVAVGLLAALVPEHPRDAFEIALDWLERTDDAATADALGWLVLGPSLLASGQPLDLLLAGVGRHPRAEVRRGAAMAGLAFTPARVEGPAAAALRERLGQRALRFVDQPLAEHLRVLAEAFLRDESPAVRKALRRVLTAWAEADPPSALAWAEGVRGGLPRMLREAVNTAARKARRREREA